MKVFTVSQINFFLKSLIEDDGRLRDIYISGEISNFTDHYRSGHLYFSVKDDKSVLKAVMFSSAARRLRFAPQNGMKVILRGRVSVYEAGGQYQLYVEEMQPDGIGALSLAFEQMKEKLDKEGLFSPTHKKPIPRFPKRVGVITSPTGAAVQDMIHILSRRWPCAEMIFSPVLVQGENAAPQLKAAVEEMNRLRCADVILIGRGGGSAEDLFAFNDEALARAIYASDIPVISAVGHETDFTICDFVADLRAPTPSAAAELAVPDRAEWLLQLRAYQERLRAAALSFVEDRRQRLDYLLEGSVLLEPQQYLESMRTTYLQQFAAFSSAAEHYTLRKRETLGTLSARLDAMSPLKVLQRGYAMVSGEDERVLSSVEEIKQAKTVSVRVSDGTVQMTVTETE